MRLLLDTHLFRWAMADDDRLPTEARELMLEADEVSVSAASIWEIAIKARIGKLKVDAGYLVETLEAGGFVELPVTARHAAGVTHLPGHHTDPFDRLLIAQATAEPLILLTVDRQLAAYGDIVLVV